MVVFPLLLVLFVGVGGGFCRFWRRRLILDFLHIPVTVKTQAGKQRQQQQRRRDARDHSTVLEAFRVKPEFDRMLSGRYLHAPQSVVHANVLGGLAVNISLPAFVGTVPDFGKNSQLFGIGVAFVKQFVRLVSGQADCSVADLATNCRCTLCIPGALPLRGPVRRCSAHRSPRWLRAHN